jgi:prevent-host-death family protein
MVMKRMPAGKFKAQCLKVMDDVLSTRQPVLITKRGRPVAKLVPAEEQSADVFGCMKGQIEIVGDIISPAIPLEDWDVLR